MNIEFADDVYGHPVPPAALNYGPDVDSKVIEIELRKAEKDLTQLTLAYFDDHSLPSEKTASAVNLQVEMIGRQRRLVARLQEQLRQSVQASYDAQRAREAQEQQAQVEKQRLGMEAELREALYAQHKLRQESRLLRERLQELSAQVERAERHVVHCQKAIDDLQQSDFIENQATDEALTLTLQTEK